MKLKGLGEFRVLTLREEIPVTTGDNPAPIAEYWRAHIATDPRHNPEVESLWGICLSTRRKITGCYLVATGTLDTILAHPREVFRPAIVAAASAFLLIHNHPSGDPTPSEADIKITREIMRGGQLLRIELLDHLIMGQSSATCPQGYCSLRELGYMFASV